MRPASGRAVFVQHTLDLGIAGDLTAIRSRDPRCHLVQKTLLPLEGMAAILRASAITSDTDMLERAAIASMRACNSGVISRSIVMLRLSLGGEDFGTRFALTVWRLGSSADAATRGGGRAGAKSLRPEKLIQRLAHHAGVDVDAGPVLDADDALVDQHAQAVEHLAAARLGVADQPGARRIGDDVGDDHARRQRIEVEGEARVDIGKEADRGGVDDDVGAVRDAVGAAPIRRSRRAAAVFSLSRSTSSRPRASDRG